MKDLRLCCIVVVAAASALGAQYAPGRIEMGELRKLHAAKKVLVVDVRDDQSFADGHIPGAVNIPLGDEEQAVHFHRLKAEKRPIVTYCA